MLEWAHPPLLLLLALLPLLRWLHRRGSRESELLVSALFLWPEEAPAEDSERRLAKPHPRWRLRALVAALLLATASGPSFTGPKLRRVDAYLDERPSLQVREGQASRLDLAIRSLREAVEESRVGELRILSLRRPSVGLVLDPARPSSFESEIRRWVRIGHDEGALPLPAQLDLDREQWVVTDAADPRLAPWLREMPVDRVIQVGRETENVGVTRIAVRPLPNRPSRTLGIVRVTNGGMRRATRRLEVRRGEHVLLREELSIPPGQVTQLPFELRSEETGPLRAVVEPADALPEDDVLELSRTSAERVSLRLDPRCGAPLRRALFLHPGLEVSETDAPLLTVWCSAPLPRGSDPVLWFHPERGDRTRLPHDGFERGVVQVRRDMESRKSVDSEDYVVFVSELLDRAAGRRLLDRSVLVQTAEDTTAIAPKAIPRYGEADDHRVARMARDVSSLPLALAALGLLIDVWRTARGR